MQEYSLKQHFRAPKVKEGYRLPKTLWIMRELATVLPELQKDAAFMQEGRKLREDFDTMQTLRNQTYGSIEGLRAYQSADVHYLQYLQSAGIFNEPRTGKTATLIKLLAKCELVQSLVVVPASLMYNWAAEFEKFSTIPVIVADGSAKKRMEAYESGKTVIVSKSSLSTDVANMKHIVWDACVVDEAHFLRNYQSKQSKAVYAVKAKRRYALTGTPTVKGSEDIYGILKFLEPTKYPSYWQFVERYFPVTDSFWGGKEIGAPYQHRVKELKEMVSSMSVQRTRLEVMPWLPKKQRTTIEVQMGDKQTKLYNQMVKTFMASDDLGNDADAQNVIGQMMRLRQICQDPHLLGLEAPSAKTEALLEYVEGHNEPLVIMSWFTSYLKQLAPMLESAGRKVGMIHGEMSATEKAESARLFQAGEYDILLCNIISAGTGFTLNRSNTVIFLDKAFTPSENEQAEDRVCPTIEGLDLKHEIVSIVCKGSIDKRINQIIERKENLTTLLNRGGAEFIREMIT